MLLMACAGPIAIRVQEQMLIERGILALPIFKLLRLTKHPSRQTRDTGWATTYKIGIIDYEHRNDLIIDGAVRAARYGQSALTPVQLTRHGEILRNLEVAARMRAIYNQSEEDQGGRKNALRAQAAPINLLIGTIILDVGVDVPAVGHGYPGRRRQGRGVAAPANRARPARKEKRP